MSDVKTLEEFKSEDYIDSRDIISAIDELKELISLTTNDLVQESDGGVIDLDKWTEDLKSDYYESDNFFVEPSHAKE